MSKESRIYVVTQGDTKRLVEAKSGAAARQFAASDIKVELASQKTLVALLADGVKVEKSEVQS